MEQTPSTSDSASLVSAAATGSPTLDIFEVFKFGHASRQELEQMPLEQLRSRYTMLVPIDSKQQLQAAAELATVPKEGHMVVDKTHFKQMMEREVRKQVDLAMKQMKAKQDAHIFNSHDAFQRDRKMVSELLQGSIEIERNKLRALADQFSGEQRTKADLLQALDSYVKEQKQVWDVILKHPFFKGEEEEEPQEGTEGQRASSD